MIDSALNPILEEFTRGESFGAYKFKYPQSIGRDIEEILKAQIELLKQRETSEIETTFYSEQFSAYAELTNNLEKYGILTKTEGQIYETNQAENEKRMNTSIEKQQKHNHELAKIIGEFITKNSLNENNDVLQSIRKILGTTANQELEHILFSAEKETELGWLQWMSIQTFASRCKRGMVGLTAVGGAGGLGGTVAGFGILSPITATIGTLTGGLVGGTLGFMSPDITEISKAKINELKKMATNFAYGETNKICAEYFKDPIAITGLNPKYEPTDRMIATWGEKGAEVIAYAYVNLLFEMHAKILYLPSSIEKEELEQKYHHFYRNYQMMRGDEKEIRNIYKEAKWGTERAETQIGAAKKLNLVERLKEDLAAVLLIANKEDNDCTNKIRSAINVVSSGIKKLTSAEDETLILQLEESPEYKLLPSSIAPQKVGATLTIEVAQNKSERKSQSETSAKSQHSEKTHVMKATNEGQLITKAKQSLHEIMVIDATALEHQQLITKVKEHSRILAKAKVEKDKVKEKYHHIDAMTKIAVNDKHTAENIEKVTPGFLETKIKSTANMNTTDAADSLKSQDYHKFNFWFENIFLVKYKTSDNLTRKDVISRSLLNNEGFKMYEGRSLWHLLAEDSISGNDSFTFMMRKQAQTGFEPFASYFDFDYVDEHGMNAIVYAASLSSEKNNLLLNAYINELITRYPKDRPTQKHIDKTFGDAISIHDPENHIYMPLCTCFVKEIKDLWEKKEREKSKNQSITAMAFSYVTASSTAKYDEDKVLSALLATLAIHCTNGNQIPKTKQEIISFLSRLSKSEYFDESLRTLIVDITKKEKIAENTITYIEQQTILYQFAQQQTNEKIKLIALDISTFTPMPTKEEQDLLIAILSNGTPENIEKFKFSLKNNKALIEKLIYENKKFNGRNLMWLAIEAQRPDIVKELYLLSNKIFMDDSGPDGSAFTFAAKQENKESLIIICDAVQQVKASSGLTRFKADNDKSIAAHYVFQHGSWNAVEGYFMTEARYRNPNYKRLTGGPDVALLTEPKFHLDNNQNTPLHLLAQRSDAAEIFRKLNDFASTKNLTLLDFFDIASLNLVNKVKQTSFALICQNPEQQNVFFKPLLSAEIVRDKCLDTNFQDYLIKCIELTVNNRQFEFTAQLNNSLSILYSLNIPRALSYYINPMGVKISNMIDNIIETYLHDASPKDQCDNILVNLKKWGALVPDVKITEMLNKLAGDAITMKNYLLTQTLVGIANEREILSKDQIQKYLQKYHGANMEILEPQAILPSKATIPADGESISAHTSKLVEKNRGKFTPSRDAKIKQSNEDNKEIEKSFENKDINDNASKSKYDK